MTAAIPGEPPQFDQTLKAIASLPPQPGRARVLELLNALRLSVPHGDRHAWSKLKPLIMDQNGLRAVRSGVLQIAMEKADESIGVEVLDLASSESAAVFRLLEQGAAPKQPIGVVLEAVIPLLDEAPWKDWNARRPDNGMDLIRQISTGSGLTPESRRMGLEALRSSPVDRDRKRTAAEQIIAATPTQQASDPLLLELLDDASFPNLRALVVDSGGDPRSFHWHAAFVLGHFGDQGILPHLVSLLNANADATPVDPTMPNLGAKFRSMLQGTVRMIEMQHPPEGLLDYIASDENPLDSTRRAWAITRAVEHPLDHVAIRNAVLSHGARLRDLLKAGKLPGRQDRAPAPLSVIKSTAVRLEVLAPSDWPDVALVGESQEVTK